MEAELQRRVQRHGWNRAAAHYESGWRRQLAPAQHRLPELAALAPGERVLDVACGTGLVTLPAAALVGPTGSVVATDIAERMVEQVRTTAHDRGFTNVEAFRMDAEALDCASTSFDAVLCALGLMYVPDPEIALWEMCRVTRRGGRAVVAVWAERAACGWAEIFPIVERRVRSTVCPLFFRLGTGNALAAAMLGAGFTAVRQDRVDCVLRYASGDAACDAAFEGGPVALAYSRFDARVRAEARAKYLESIARWRHGDGYEVPGAFVVVRGDRR